MTLTLLNVLKRSCELSSAGDLGRYRALSFAVGAAGDHHHVLCTELLSSATEQLLVSATVTAEVCYLLERRAGTRSEAAFLRLFLTGRLALVAITTGDYECMAESWWPDHIRLRRSGSHRQRMTLPALPKPRP